MARKVHGHARKGVSRQHAVQSTGGPWAARSHLVHQVRKLGAALMLRRQQQQVAHKLGQVAEAVQGHMHVNLQGRLRLLAACA